jgi:hypothetical protein
MTTTEAGKNLSHPCAKVPNPQFFWIAILTDSLCFLTDPLYNQRFRIQKCRTRLKNSLESCGEKISRRMCYHAESVLLAAYSVIIEEISARLQMLILSLVNMSAIHSLIRAKNMRIRKEVILIRHFLAVGLTAISNIM